MHVASVLWQVARKGSRTGAGKRARTARAVARAASRVSKTRLGRASRAGIVVARPFGIPVFVSPYAFVIAGVFILIYANDLSDSLHGNIRFAVAAAFIVLLGVSVLVHELAHSVVALGFGLPVRRILLYPLGGISEIDKEPQTPAREFLVSAAGPALSLALGAVGWALLLVVNHGVGGSLVRFLCTRTSSSASSTCCPGCRWTAAGCSAPSSGSSQGSRIPPRSPPPGRAGRSPSRCW